MVNLAYLAILAVFFFFQSSHNLEGFTLTTGILILGDVGAGPLLVLVLELEGQEDGRHQHRHAHRRAAARVIMFLIAAGGLGPHFGDRRRSAGGDPP